jgi:hypothetical protein
MANTYTLIQTIPISSSVASVTFSAIPQTYTDLIMKVFARTDRASGVSDAVYLQFNNSTSSYTGRYVYTDGSSVGSQSYSSIVGASATSAGATSNVFSNCEVYITNYTGSMNKTFINDSVTENNATQSYLIYDSGMWANSAAITSIVCVGINGNIVAGSTLSLYGISKS